MIAGRLSVVIHLGPGLGPGARRTIWRIVVAVMIAMFAAAPPSIRADDPLASPPAEHPVESKPLDFTRVHVPAGQLSEIRLGPGRYVPMSAREFEAGIARLSGGRLDGRDQPLEMAVSSLADAARYQLSRAKDGSLTGTVTFDVGGFTGGIDDQQVPRVGMARELSLGTLDVRSAAMRTAAGRGEAVVFGRPDGTVAMVTVEPGTYSCDFRCAAELGAADSPRFSLPLVPALSSSITLRLPRGVQPVVGGDLPVWRLRPRSPEQAADSAGGSQPDLVAWQIDTGPRATLDLTLVADEAAPPLLTLWTKIGIRGRQASLDVLVQPIDPWRPGTVRIEKDPSVLVTQVTAAVGAQPDTGEQAVWTEMDGGRTLLIDLPRRSLGSRGPLAIKGVAPVPDSATPLPLLRLPAESWSGGGIAIQSEAALSLTSIDLEQCQVVPPEVAGRWPLPVEQHPAAETAATPMRLWSEPLGTAPGVAPSRMFVEEQTAGATVTLSVRPRTPDIDVTRVTTVDLSPGVVVGRAACAVRVQRGECFALTARITPGWFIDSVEALPLTAATELSDATRWRGADEPAAGLDWKVLRDTRGDLLRIGLITGATPARGLGLRITGHRAGIPLEEDFSTAEIDMIRFDGETERSALIDLRTSPETTVEFTHDPAPDRAGTAAVDPAQADFQVLETDSRLAGLMEEGAARARVWAGFRAASRTARLVRRRPPLDARTEVRLTVRDDRLTESVTFECHPAASDLDSIVVQFSEPVDDLLEWSLLPPAVGTVTARRLDASERRPPAGGTVSSGVDRWLVEVNPPARGTVTIRAARTIPFVQATPVLLAWVDGATSAVGHLLVRNVGRLRPQVVNRRLTEVPPETAGADPAAVTLAEFSFEPAAAFDSADLAAAELAPGGDDARAWASRESTSSWCHASGATEYETLFDIDNHGRTSLSLSIPPGRRVEGILLNGVRLPLGERAAAGGQVPIVLPAGRSLVTLMVQTVVDGERAPGRLGSGPWSAWRIAPPGVKLDAPVLQREWRLLLPPELEIASIGGSARNPLGTGRHDWVTRLLGAVVRPLAADAPAVLNDGVPGSFSPTPESAGPLLQGVREVLLLPAGDGGGDAGVVVVHARVVSAVAVVAGIAAGCGGLLLMRVRPQGTVLLSLVAGIAALWIAAPFDGIARAAWWGSLAALAVGTTGWLPNRRNEGQSGGGGGRLNPWEQGSLPVVLLALCLTAAPIAAAADPVETVADAATDDSATNRSEPPLQVFVMPSAAGPAAGRAADATSETQSATTENATVLVPEELFRMLVRGEDARSLAAVRVLAVRVTAAPPGSGDEPWSAWRVAIDIDADTGGILLLDQAGSGGRFTPGSLRIDGAVAAARLAADGSLLRIVVPAAGRQVVTVDVEAASQRRGAVETTTIAIPLAPVASLSVLPTAGRVAAAGVVCERAAMTGDFTTAPRRSADAAAVVFDLSRATAVRLVRSVNASVDLAELPPTAVSRNDIFWNLDECRLTGVYEVAGGDSIVRSCVVRAAPGLEWIAPTTQSDPRPADDADGADGVMIRPLGDQRFLVERRRPERGDFRFEIPFRMPLADPVGVFTVPEAWLEDALMDARSVRFVASPSLAVRIDLPAGLTHAAIPDGEASFETRFWRGDVSRADTAMPFAGGMFSAAPVLLPPSTQRARLTSERRRQELRGSQRETVVFAREQVRIQLDARLDASSLALVTIPLTVPAGSVIDRIELFEDDMLHPETAERGAIDLRWSRRSDTGVAVVVQRPRAGRFRLEVDARIPGRPARQGSLPELRVGLADNARSLIEWRAEDGLRATVEARPHEPAVAERAATRDQEGLLPVAQCELVSGDPLPMYELAFSPASALPLADEAESPPAATEEPAVGAGRVELADIRLAVDGRGRAWGLACFEMVSPDPVVRIQLPRSWRLYDTVVDGRPVDCVVPAAVPDTIWELRLHDVGRPRSIVALFAGELLLGERSRQLVEGEPLALSPPAIVGLDCRRVIWTIQVPTGITLRVAAPARVVSVDELREERRAAQQRLRDDAQQAIERIAGWQQERLRTFLETRRNGESPVADRLWSRPLTALTGPLPPALGIVAADVAHGQTVGQITIRAVRQRDPTAWGRALATLSLLACGGITWMAMRRTWSVRPTTWVRVASALALVTGVAWCLLLVPAWPGLLLMAGAVVAAMWTRPTPPPVVMEPAAVDNRAVATTIYRPQP